MNVTVHSPLKGQLDTTREVISPDLPFLGLISHEQHTPEHRDGNPHQSNGPITVTSQTPAKFQTYHTQPLQGATYTHVGYSMG